MDRIPNSSANSSTDPSDSRIQSNVKSLNKNSYKISKLPTTTTTTTTSSSKAAPNPNPLPNPNQQSQPPVYNIDKNDFHEVVQKLTGSPIHHTRPSSSPSPSPPPPPPPATSRLHRIRPPPLANLSAPSSAMASSPFSPLPPLPTVSTTAESPITAYMKRLRGGGTAPTVSAPLLPSSPLGFGCIPPSPRTTAAAYGMGTMLPTSPRMSALSPR